MASPAPSSGGFIRSSLPSPNPTSATSSPSPSSLPHPRSAPLRPGSAKEEAARRYVETKLLHISRRYTKKFQPPAESVGVLGYTSMRDVCRDLSEVVNVLWLSGTPSLQVPYLLNIALAVSTYLSAFPPAPAPTFALLKKMDHAFASLLQGSDVETGMSLPGFEGRRGGMSRTDMVRCKSLVEATRVQVVELMSREAQMEDEEREDETDMDRDRDTDVGESAAESVMEGGSTWDEDNEGHNMDVARVYARTIVQLGEALNDGTAYDAGGST